MLDARCGLRRFVGRTQQLLDARHHGLQPFLVHGFEQIGDGIGFERRQRVFVVGGDEHDERHLGGVERFDHLESAEARHLDVEEHHLRAMLADGLERLETVARVRLDELEGIGREHLPQPRAGRRFIVGDQGANGHAGVSRG